MTENNEVMTVNEQTGEIVSRETPQTKLTRIVEDYPTYDIIQTPDGKKHKRAKYARMCTIPTETKEDKIKVYNLLNSRDDSVKEMKTMKNATIEIKNVIFNPYSKFDELLNIDSNQVNTIIETTDGEYIATSSKGVYFDLQNMFDIFGVPGSDGYDPLKVQIRGKKSANGEQINLKLLA